MKFSISQTELARLTSTVQRAASTHDTVPALAGLLIDVSDHILTMTATDLEMVIKSSTDRVNISEPGTVLTNAHYFGDLVRFLPETELLVYTDDENSRLVISYGRSESHLNLYNPEEFPDVEMDHIDHLLTLPHDTLREMLRQTSFATAVNHFRQVFTGVLFDIESEQLRIVASDTHRLALTVAQLDNSIEPRQFVVPARTVNELTRILEDPEGTINIGFIDHNVVFYHDDIFLLSRLLEGQYPNYNPVIPQSFVSTILLDTRTLVNALERAALMPGEAYDKGLVRHITLDIKDNEVHLSSYSEKMGEINEVIEDTPVTGETGIRIAFNTRYLLDVAKMMQNIAPQLQLNLTGSLSPALIKNPEQDDYVYVLVPLLTN